MKHLATSCVLLALCGCGPRGPGSGDGDVRGGADVDGQGTDTDTGEASDSEADSDSDTDTSPPRAMCDDTLVIDPPFRLSGADWTSLEGRVDYEYELPPPPNGPEWRNRSCDPTPPNFWHYNSYGINYQTGREEWNWNWRPSQEIRMEVWLEAGEKVRVIEGPLRELVYVQAACDPSSWCFGASSREVPLTVVAPEAGVYIVVVESLDRDGDIAFPYDIFVEVLGPEICDDGVDNDDDGYVDCADTECGIGDGCVGDCVAIPFVPPQMTGSADGLHWANTEYGPPYHESCSELALPPALIFEMQLEVGQRVVATTDDPDFQQTVSFSQECGLGHECEYEHGYHVYRHIFDVPESGTWYATIQSETPVLHDQVNWVVGIVEPEQCDTDVDEDLDGYTSCLDSDCLFDPYCGFECPAPQPTPIVLQGDNWSADYPNLWGFAQENGCIGDGGQDALVSVEAEVGDVITVTDPTSGRRAMVNILPANSPDCVPMGDETSCVYGAWRDAAYEVEEAGLYYVSISTHELGYEREYYWQIDVVSP